MKLVHLTTYTPDAYTVVVENDEKTEYDLVSIYPGEPNDIQSRFFHKDYTDRAHFAGVVGKFMPYVWILDEEHEIDIEELSLPELRRAEVIINARNK